MSMADVEYLKVVKEVVTYGDSKTDRTGTGTISMFGKQMRFDLRDGFPLLTIKKMHFKSIIGELIWFMRGNSNLDYLKDNKITIWDEWAKPDGTIGPGYPVQWRHWQGKSQEHDQLRNVVNSIINNPDSRRLIVNAWNVDLIDEMALPPCHFAYQFNVVNTPDGNFIDIIWYQRSADLFLGVPFNIASYAALLMIVGRVTQLTPRYVVGSFADTHIYSNHISQVEEILSRDPMKYKACKLLMHPAVDDIDHLDIGQFTLSGYESYPKVSAPVAV